MGKNLPGEKKVKQSLAGWLSVCSGESLNSLMDFFATCITLHITGVQKIFLEVKWIVQACSFCSSLIQGDTLSWEAGACSM